MWNGHANFLVLIDALLPAHFVAFGLHDHAAVLPNARLATLVHLFTGYKSKNIISEKVILLNSQKDRFKTGFKIAVRIGL